jgi:predicted anti-sigma-YlaC factor YlaD
MTMTRKAITEQQIARLQQAVESAGELTCEQVRTALAAFVAAERDGVDVDADPVYAALLRHLDSCADCNALYAAIAEDLAALVGPAEVLPQVELTPPTFFTTARQNDSVLLRVIAGRQRRFELDLALPQLTPMIATLGSAWVTLFSDSLIEVDGAPLVSVAMRASTATVEMLVTVRDSSAATRWQMQLTLDGTTHVVATDARGAGHFVDLAVAGSPELRLSIIELAAI